MPQRPNSERNKKMKIMQVSVIYEKAQIRELYYSELLEMDKEPMREFYEKLIKKPVRVIRRYHDLICPDRSIKTKLCSIFNVERKIRHNASLAALAEKEYEKLDEQMSKTNAPYNPPTPYSSYT